MSEAPGYSFPSGHALNSAAWSTIVVILLWPLLRTRVAKVVLVVLAVLVVGMTAADRVLLGVHYPSDVTVGVLTGVGLALRRTPATSGGTPRTRPRPRPDPDPSAHDAGPQPHPPPPGDLMPFLTRWEEDQSRPTFGRPPSATSPCAPCSPRSACSRHRGVRVHAHGPAVRLLRLGEQPSRWFQDARTETGETITLFMSTIGNTEYVIGVCLLVVGDPLVAHEAVVVRRHPRHRDLAPGDDLRHRGAGRRPGPPNVERLGPDPTHVELPERARGRRDRAVHDVRVHGRDPHPEHRGALVRHRLLRAGRSASPTPGSTAVPTTSATSCGASSTAWRALLAWNYLRREPATVAHGRRRRPPETAQTRA